MPSGEPLDQQEQDTSVKTVRPIRKRKIVLAAVFAAAVAGAVSGGLWATDDQRLVEGAQDNAGWKVEMASLFGLSDEYAAIKAFNHAIESGNTELSRTIYNAALLEFSSFRNEDFAFRMLQDAVTSGQHNAAMSWVTQATRAINDREIIMALTQEAIMQGMTDVAVLLADHPALDESALTQLAISQNVSDENIGGFFNNMDQAALRALMDNVFDYYFENQDQDYVLSRAQQILSRLSSGGDHFIFEYMLDQYDQNPEKAAFFLERFGAAIVPDRLFGDALDNNDTRTISWFMENEPQIGNRFAIHAASQIAASYDDETIDREANETRLSILREAGVDLNPILAEYAFNPFFAQTLPVLVSFGADINGALNITAANNDAGGFAAIIDALGADMAFNDFEAVRIAVENGSVLVLEDALRRDAENNNGMMIYEYGARFLMDAVYARNERAANLLIDAGAHYMLRNWQRNNIAEISAREGFPVVFSALIEDIGIDLRRSGHVLGQIYAPYFNMAAESGHVDILRLNLNEDVNVNIGAGQAIIRAARGGHLEAVEFLHTRGARLDFHNGEALFTAAHNDHYDVVEFLTRVRPSLLQMRDGGAISHAYANQNRDMFDLFLVRGIEGFDNTMRTIIDDNNLDYAESVFAAFAGDERTLAHSVISYLENRGSQEMIALFESYGRENLEPAPSNFREDYIENAVPRPIPFYDWAPRPDEETAESQQTPAMPSDPRP